ncbi:hypothetical protein E3N88_46142 [Mikania micrantha]|uniref:F-box domain-containing protein n=1 Tax=Mikania micrantha TaxID=192012 RepID=A0A5N6L753_9ASTR|nr:hypothetical protein E3N88_46143 [Mikania micrantha]KAC9242336.1 hypothetical protein E3N88_46142 [Mikania micrantha]
MLQELSDSGSTFSGDMLPDEMLKAVFPLLEGTDLAACMSVCKQWHQMAQDDYFWKCLCAKRWPSTSRKDSNKVACIINKSIFDYIDRSSFRALAFDYLMFSPVYPFVAGIRAWISLLFMEHANENVFDVFGIEIDFCDAANSEDEVLWLLDMLDWK